MNKDEVIKQFYFTINYKTVEDCYGRVMEHENCYNHVIKDENIIVDDENVTAICYKGLLWALNEVGVQKTVQQSDHPNSMYSVYNTEYVTLKKHDIGSM